MSDLFIDKHSKGIDITRMSDDEEKVRERFGVLLGDRGKVLVFVQDHWYSKEPGRTMTMTTEEFRSLVRWLRCFEQDLK